MRDWDAEIGEVAVLFLNRGYDVEAHDEGGLPKLEFKAKEANLPEITAHAEVEEGVIYFSTEVSFPTLRSEDLEYSDDYSHYLNRWADVGVALTELVKLSLPLERDWDD